MLERKIYYKLQEWKSNKDKMCLVVKGARQVGKTYIIDKFCRENYKNYVYINFYEDFRYSLIFEGNLSADTIYSQIKARVTNANIIPNETIIFLDEIQECPNAIMALKFLAMDKNVDVIASGSLLGINYKEIKSYPVGYVEYLEMYSLDFEEFCWAKNISKDLILELKNCFLQKKQVLPGIHDRMMEIFREYIIVGGMPKVVDNFILNNDYNLVRKLQSEIIESYKNDIAKYAKDNDRAKIHSCFLSIPKQLAKDYKKFTFNLVEKGGRSSKYQGSLEWLRDAGIVNFCYNVSLLEAPLEGYAKNDCFKVYMRDTGLLMAMLEDNYAEDILDGNLGIYKGAIYENIIADIFTKLEKKLYYFEYNSTLELDFILRYNKKITAIEVKSGDNTKSKALNSAIDNWNVEQGIKFSTKNVGVSDKIITYPLYMAMFM